MLPKALRRAQDIALKIRDQQHAGATVCKAATAANATGELFLYGLIGDVYDAGIMKEDVAAALQGLGKVETLNVYLSSEGGDVFEAATIYAQLARFEAKKVVHIDGIAASAATLIAMAGDRIIMSPAAEFMIHNPWTLAVGEAADFRAVADRLDHEADNLAQQYARRTGKDVAELRRMMDAETWLNASETVEAGFADEVAVVGDQKPADKNRTRLAAAIDRTHELVTPAALMTARAQMRNLSRVAGHATPTAGRGQTHSPPKATK